MDAIQPHYRSRMHTCYNGRSLQSRLSQPTLSPLPLSLLKIWIKGESLQLFVLNAKTMALFYVFMGHII